MHAWSVACPLCMHNLFFSKAENTSYLKIVLEDYMKSDHIWARYVNDAVAKRMDRQGELGCKLMSEYFCRALGGMHIHI